MTRAEIDEFLIYHVAGVLKYHGREEAAALAATLRQMLAAPPEQTYLIIEPPRRQNGAERAILCLQCYALSYNPTDIEQRYCGQCHTFHEANPS